MRELAIKMILDSKAKSRDDLTRAKRRAAKEYGVGILTNSEILAAYQDLVARQEISPRPRLESLLRKRRVRTLSGIAPVAVLTAPYPCPGKCAYCPREDEVPQSYLSNEPAVMRAIRCQYDPYRQVQDRIRALEVNGHEATKIELIVIGGTWSVLPRKYKHWYLANCFRAANDYERSKSKDQKSKISKKTSLGELKKILTHEQKRNEKAKHRLIGVTLETRPDHIDNREAWEMRELGCTRVELGVQAIDDKILELNRRGHGVAEIAGATELLRSYGFKLTYHLMPGLPGSSWHRDLEMFKQLFTDKRFRPDQIKFYPTVVTRGSLLYKWWQQGSYTPYTDQELRRLIIECKKTVPRYVRIIRLIRDIPGESIEAGNLVTNLRQVMQDQGAQCECIRCREARDKQFRKKDVEADVIKYEVAGGQERFISFRSADGGTLYGFCRLFLPADTAKSGKAALKQAALVRELHVYGRLVSPGAGKAVQHSGLGKDLLARAETQARQQGYGKMAVISGVGVRGYYRRFGYRLRETYMVKGL